MNIKSVVKEKYGSAARSELSGSLSGTRLIAHAFGYTEEELASIPAEANLGLSCGNPTATASLREGEVVVDLVCGGGLDVFLAAQKVGSSGRAIGIDMTPEMIERATRNAVKAGHDNVQFHLAEIEVLPLERATVDCVISNCVLNLVPDKAAAFSEIFRVLKPGGRLAVTDIALKVTLPEELADDLNAYVGCIAGAMLIADYERGLREAGFDAVQVVDSQSDLNAYATMENQSGCCTPEMSSPGDLHVVDGDCCGPAPSEDPIHSRLADLLKRYDVNDYAASVRVFAVKPLDS